MLDRDPEGTVAVGGIHKWVLDGNWKLAAEQFATDWYHVNMSHASALMVLSPTAADEVGDRQHPGRQFSDPLGHGAGFPTHPRSRFDAQPVTSTTTTTRLRERLGDERVEGPMTTGHATVFPNSRTYPSTAASASGTRRVRTRWRSGRGPSSTSRCPRDVREAQRLYNLRTFVPAASSSRTTERTGASASPSQAVS